jgi:hypothetical protein
MGACDVRRNVGCASPCRACWFERHKERTLFIHFATFKFTIDDFEADRPADCLTCLLMYFRPTLQIVIALDQFERTGTGKPERS